MRKTLKAAVISAAIAAAGASSAGAMNVYSVNTANAPVPLAAGSTANAYPMAYEVYNNAAGATTDRMNGKLALSLTKGGATAGQDHIDIIISNSVAYFNTASAMGPGSWYYVLIYDSDIDGSLGDELDAYANAQGLAAWDSDADGNSENGLVAYYPVANAITSQLSMDVVQNLPAGTVVYLGVARDVDGGGLLVDGDNDSTIDIAVNEAGIGVPGAVAEIPGASAGLRVNPGLAPDCNTNPTIDIQVSTDASGGDAAEVTFAYITPQYTVDLIPPAVGNNLDAELEPVNGATFLATYPTYVSPTRMQANTFIRITNNLPGSAIPWILWDGVGFAGATTTYQLHASRAENGISQITAGGVACTTSDHQTWTCTHGTVGFENVRIDLDGTTENFPVNWDITGLTITSPSWTNNLCVPADQSVGVWHRGLEAIVPLVKHDPNGNYETYIALTNRNSVDAPVYVTTFANGDTNNMMLATGQITGKEAIPAGGRLTITGEDIANYLSSEGINYDMAQGVTVKLQIYAPTSMNPMDDPFIEGRVVDANPSGQRHQPIYFKWWKNGRYNQQ